MIKMAVFLGNFGKTYLKTRHNFAWMLCDKISESGDITWQKKFRAFLAADTLNNRKVFLLKPLTYMNRSGESVLSAMSYFRFLPEEILVAHDDLELSFGKIAFKEGGGMGGHNGLGSIARSTGTKSFKRLRLGISRPEHDNISSYVLSRFSSEESKDIDGILGKAAILFKKTILS